MSTSLASRRRSIYSEALVRRVVALDALVNVAGAGVLWAGVGAWKSAFGLTTALPVIALSVLFFVNGIECWTTARREHLAPAWLWGLAAVDGAFGAFGLLVAASDPTGADMWARWLLAAVADAALIVGAVKGYAAYRIARDGARGA